MDDPRIAAFEDSDVWQVAARNWVDSDEGRAAFAGTAAYGDALDQYERLQLLRALGKTNRLGCGCDECGAKERAQR